MKAIIYISGLLTIMALAMLSGCSKTSGSHSLEDRKRLALIHSNLAYEYVINNNLAVALGEAHEALRMDEFGVQPNYAMARVQLALKNQQLAVEHFKIALRTNRKAVKVLNDYAKLLCASGNTEQAIEFYRLAGQQPSRYSMTSYSQAAACLAKNNQLHDAEEFLMQALILNPQSDVLLLNLARINYRLNQDQRGDEFMKKRKRLLSKNKAN